MPDTPDWSVYRIGTDRHSLQDLAEHAARVGSIVTYDRRGSVMFADSFEDGLNPYTLFQGADPTLITLYTTSSFRGANSALFNLAAAAGNSLTLRKYLPVYALGRTGIEFHFAPDSKVPAVVVGLSNQTATTQFIYYVKVDFDNDALYYYNSSGSYVSFADLTLSPKFTAQWFVCKLVVDFGSDKYVRFQLDNNSYDLSSYDPYPLAQVQALASYGQITISPDAADAITCLVDDVILTVDEP